MDLFSGVHYHLSSSLSSKRQAELTYVLDNNGGSPVDSLDPTLTHFITNSNLYEGWQDVTTREEAGELAVVTASGIYAAMSLS
jgi:hypothetical protein